jgi:hypothetical protein
VKDAKIQMTVKKPSLMALTMLDMKKKQEQKQNETEFLLKELEMRAKLITSKTTSSTNLSNTPKTLKSFKSLVRLQEPGKLRRYKTEHKPMTYTQQLKQYQETTVVPESSHTSATEMHKVYGSRRMPHSATSSLRTTPRGGGGGGGGDGRKVKTYAERLRELRPAESQAKIATLNSIQRRHIPNKVSYQIK